MIEINEEWRYESSADEVQEGQGMLIETIGYNVTLDHRHSAPNGIPAWRIMLFHYPCNICFGTDVINLQAYSLLVIPPGQKTSYGSDNVKIVHSWIRVKGVAIREKIERAGIPLMRPIVFDSALESDRWLTMLRHVIYQADESIIEGVFDLWIKVISAKLIGGKNREIPAVYRKVRDYIHTNAVDCPSLDRLAEVADLSPTYLCEEYRRYFDVTPVEHAIITRIAAARKLLEDTTLSIAQVSERSGHCNPFYFARVFKKHMGISPSVWRKSCL